MPALALDLIRTDGGTQARVALDDATVGAYAEAIAGGAKFPPIDVFYDGATHWLADGFHRFFAHREAERKKIDAKVHQGTRDDALLFAVGANSVHGLRRTNDDKRHAVQMLLASAKWSKRSDAWIADRCVVSPHTVAKLRPLEPTMQTHSREGRDGKTRDVSNIGRSKPRPPAPPVDDGTDEVAELFANTCSPAESADRIARARVERAEMMRPKGPAPVVDFSPRASVEADEREVKRLMTGLPAESFRRIVSWAVAHPRNVA